MSERQSVHDRFTSPSNLPFNKTKVLSEQSKESDKNLIAEINFNRKKRIQSMYVAELSREEGKFSDSSESDREEEPVTKKSRAHSSLKHIGSLILNPIWNLGKLKKKKVISTKNIRKRNSVTRKLTFTEGNRE